MTDTTLTMTAPLDLNVDVAARENGSLKHFDRMGPEVHFTLPARPTVKQQLEYFSRYTDTRHEPMYLRLWYSAQTLIAEWHCAALPDLKTDLNQITDPEAATAIMWAGNQVLEYMSELEALPKA